jgi:hypothetical protein
VRFEIHTPGDDSDEIGVLELRFPQTVEERWCVRRSMRSGSIAIAPNAPNRNSPWMMQTWTVEFWCEFDVEIQKQMEMMMNQDQHNKNFRIWARIEEVWWILVLCVLEKSLMNLGGFLIWSWWMMILLWLECD